MREKTSGKLPFPPLQGTMNISLCRSGSPIVPSVFQAFINDVFRDMLNQWVIVYIDDILIYSETYEAVLKRLLQHQLYAKAEKCEVPSGDHLLPRIYYQFRRGRHGRTEGASSSQLASTTTLKELQRSSDSLTSIDASSVTSVQSLAPMTSMVKKGTHRLSWSFSGYSIIPITEGEIHDRSHPASSRPRSRILR